MKAELNNITYYGNSHHDEVELVLTIKMNAEEYQKLGALRKEYLEQKSELLNNIIKAFLERE